MEKIIRTVDEAKGIVQVTTVDERWYIKPETDKASGLPSIITVPSVSWISGFYPKGIAFYKWLAEKGWNEAEALKQAAGDKGSKVHKAVEALINGAEVKMDSKFTNPSTGQEEELSLSEYECLMSFVNWFKEVKPEVISAEQIVWNDQHNYAGTMDLLCKIGGETYLIDFKTGQYVWPEYELQISAYKHALPNNENIKLAILQLGYRRNKNGYKFTDMDDKFHLFLAAKQIWENETAGQTFRQKDYPMVLALANNTASAEKPTATKATGKKAKAE